MGPRARRSSRGGNRCSRRSDDGGGPDPLAFGTWRGICLCLRKSEGDPGGDRPQPRAAAGAYRERGRDRLLSADDRRLALPHRLRREYIADMTATIRLQREPFDAAAEAAKLTHGR